MELHRPLFGLSLVLSLMVLSECCRVSAPEPGETHVDSKGIEQVWVPAGSFLMGTEDITSLDPPHWAWREIESEQPQHEVHVARDYWIDKYEVTYTAFQAFVEDGGYREKSYWSKEGLVWLSTQDLDNLPRPCAPQEAPDHPRVCVTWHEAEAYAHWRGGRLPTEAEWEYAARGPESLIYPWGNTFDENKANVVLSTGLTPVGSYPNGVSWVGAHDMAGNAMEWVQDWLDTDYYKLNEQHDPQGPETGIIKIEKGGWWGSNPYVARSAYRHFEDPPSYQDHHIGFRIVTPAETPD
jgi:formylglycine-generating enzyme required for sulfatase activity